MEVVRETETRRKLMIKIKKRRENIMREKIHGKIKRKK